MFSLVVLATLDFQDSAIVSRKALGTWLSQGLEKTRPKEDTEEESQESNAAEENAEKSATNEDNHRSESPIDPLDLLAERPCEAPDTLGSAMASVLDNSSIQCSHGDLDPMKTHEMKRIRLVSSLYVLIGQGLFLM